MLKVYDKLATEFSSNGLAILNNTIRCDVEEELNGYYGLELIHPYNSKSKHLKKDNILKVSTPQGLQLFRIDRVVKTLSNIEVYAKHIFYDLKDNFLEDCRPKNMGADEAIKYIFSNMQYPTKFKASSNLNTESTAYYIRKNPIEILLGDSETSFNSRWGGELYRDNYIVKMLEKIGQDTGVHIQYGKNLTGLEAHVDEEEVATRVMPTGLTESDSSLLLPEKYIDSPLINEYPHPKIKHIHMGEYKVNSDRTQGAVLTKDEVYQLLRDKVDHMFKMGLDKPIINYTVDFIELSKTEEYKHYKQLEELHIGDKLKVTHKELGIDTEQRVVKYIWDALNEEYIELELGMIQKSIEMTLTKVTKKADTLEEELQYTREDTYNNFVDTNNTIKETAKDIRYEMKVGDEYLNSYITQTAREIRTEVNDVDNKLHSEIVQTADKIMTYVVDENENMNSRITQTAKEIRLEVNDVDNKLQSEIVQTADEIKLMVSDTEKELNSKIEITADKIESKVQDNYRDLSSWISQEADKIEMVVDGRGDIRAAKIALAISEDYSAISMIADRIEIKPHSGIIEFPYGQDIDCRGGDIRIRNSSNNYLKISGDFDFYNRGSILASITPSGIYFKGRRVKLEGEA
ncbi:endopeptidase [Clostridium tetani]|uniref:Conserved phage-related protein n=3 Tax=Clostridium tetani TaxID=1513 RepID=Q894K0_CLOTE|nr:phage tail spike protein [Clostridium tetani]AAO36092.1 conserved phage-related protein [Clostridium tetani E88]RXI65806.1 endopeptidase [Clostridium tetani]RXM55077.1 endopeptidase [Clostridium tetani]RXM75704.1 endopeptidase [Clostridium tetani]RXM82875.1 endopeptidase [Clostridium tetani]